MKIIKPSVKHLNDITRWYNKLIDEEYGLAATKHVAVVEEEKWLNSKINDRNVIILLAEKDGKLIGMATSERLKREVDRHCAEVTFGILKGYEKEGSALLKAIIEKSRKRKIKVLVYYIFDCNQRFISIMKENGFRICGRIKKFYIKNGNYHDRIVMQKFL